MKHFLEIIVLSIRDKYSKYFSISNKFETHKSSQTSTKDLIRRFCFNFEEFETKLMSLRSYRFLSKLFRKN